MPSGHVEHVIRENVGERIRIVFSDGVDEMVEINWVASNTEVAVRSTEGLIPTEITFGGELRIAMSLDSDSVVNKIYKAVDDLNRLDKQRLEQWTAVLRRRPAEEVFNALISVFSNPLRERTRFLDQEYAGRLLLALKTAVSSHS